MEIIKHGSKMKTRVCLDCGCEFKFAKNEEKYTYIPSFLDGHLLESYHYVNCPECGCEIQA